MIINSILIFSLVVTSNALQIPILEKSCKKDACQTKCIQDFFENIEPKLSNGQYRMTQAMFNYETNLTDENSILFDLASEKFSAIQSKVALKAKDLFGDCKMEKFPKDLQRQYNLLAFTTAGVSKDKKIQKRLPSLISKMTAAYGEATVDGLPLEPDLTDIMANSRNATLLEHVYVEWRRGMYSQLPRYKEYVKLSNKAARENGYKDMSQVWLSGYDMTVKEARKMIDNILEEIKPFYKQIHCYARRKLRAHYGDEIMGKDGLIPGHLLGNMWGQDWPGIVDLLTPYPDVAQIDITPQLKKQGYDAFKIHRTSESFFKGLGLEALPQVFWDKSQLVKPQGREVVCHASADALNKTDVRIHMCTEVDMDNFLTAHHEQGHIYYFLAYKDLPFVYREGAADFFHEALGDGLALSVLVPSHLQNVGLLDKKGNYSDPRAVINYMIYSVTNRVTYMPWAYVVDRWRWEVFQGLDEDKWNIRWWELIEEFQGLKPPKSLKVKAKGAFDPASKYHIVDNVLYAQYMLAAVLSFQIHQGLCDAMGWTGPLHLCSIADSKAAGDRLKQVIGLGRSKDWRSVMKILTGGKESTVSAKAMLAWHEPLMAWLKEENKGDKCGW